MLGHWALGQYALGQDRVVEPVVTAPRAYARARVCAPSLISSRAKPEALQSSGRSCPPLLKGTTVVRRARTVIVSDSPVETPAAVTFDGNTAIGRGAVLSGMSDAATFILSVWLKNANFGAGPGRIFIQTSPNYNFYVEIGTIGNFDVNIFNAAGTSSVAWGHNGPIDFSTWRHILLAADVTVGGGVSPWRDRLFCLLDGVNIDPADFGQSGTPASGFTVGFASTETDIFVGGEDGFGDEACDMAELYFAPGQYLDFNSAPNVAKFIAAGKPVALGATGALPTGVAPALYLRGGAADFPTNLGTGGNFSTVTGTLLDASTTPY